MPALDEYTELRDIPKKLPSAIKEPNIIVVESEELLRISLSEIKYMSE